MRLDPFHFYPSLVYPHQLLFYLNLLVKFSAPLLPRFLFLSMSPPSTFIFVYFFYPSSLSPSFIPSLLSFIFFYFFTSIHFPITLFYPFLASHFLASFCYLSTSLSFLPSFHFLFPFSLPSVSNPFLLSSFHPFFPPN